jgi:hypothetical protein
MVPFSVAINVTELALPTAATNLVYEGPAFIVSQLSTYGASYLNASYVNVTQKAAGDYVYATTWETAAYQATTAANTFGLTACTAAGEAGDNVTFLTGDWNVGTGLYNVGHAINNVTDANGDCTGATVIPPSGPTIVDLTIQLTKQTFCSPQYFPADASCGVVVQPCGTAGQPACPVTPVTSTTNPYVATLENPEVEMGVIAVVAVLAVAVVLAKRKRW